MCKLFPPPFLSDPARMMIRRDAAAAAFASPLSVITGIKYSEGKRERDPGAGKDMRKPPM